jgi:anti-anti-sigma factor
MSLIGFHCSAGEFQGEPCLRLSGSARNTDADALTERLDEACKELVSILYLDLSQAKLLDSAALGAIVFQHNRLRSEGKKLVVLDPSPTCKHILQITALNRVLEILDSSLSEAGST